MLSLVLREGKSWDKAVEDGVDVTSVAEAAAASRCNHGSTSR